VATKRTTRKKKPGKKPVKKRRRKATPSSVLYSVGVIVLLAAVIYVAVSVYGLVAPRPSREVESAVIVQNGCGDEKIGLLTARYLRDRGLDVVDFKNADSFDYEETILVDRAGCRPLLACRGGSTPTSHERDLPREGGRSLSI